LTYAIVVLQVGISELLFTCMWKNLTLAGCHVSHINLSSPFESGLSGLDCIYVRQELINGNSGIIQQIFTLYKKCTNESKALKPKLKESQKF
jgi:hypothetical protein